MFSNYTWKQILEHIKYLPSNPSGDKFIITHPNNEVHYIRVRHELIYTATKQDPKNFVEIPQRIFEAIYNELQRLKRLPNKKSPNLSKIQNVEVILAILALLPETEYDKKKGSLTYLPQT